jgi:hypothetical protein
LAVHPDRNGGPMDLDRRPLLAATLLMAVAGCEKRAEGPTVNSAYATQPHIPDPNETVVLPHDKITFEVWGDPPPRSGEMAMLYGDFNKHGAYLAITGWSPGWFSAPHTYATDRICVVVSGTWWGQQWEQVLARRRRTCWAGRIRETYCPHSALRWRVVRWTRSGRDRHLWTRPRRP